MIASKAADPYPDLAKPIEYKNAPIRFTFMLDGRQEPVKIVEPEVDLPFPEGGRLVAEEAETRLCDVLFRFDPQAQRPYQLIFTIFNQVFYENGLILTYGNGVAPESEMDTTYHKSILKRGNLSARIEMSHAKARLLIQYRKGQQIPRDQPKK